MNIPTFNDGEYTKEEKLAAMHSWRSKMADYIPAPPSGLHLKARNVQYPLQNIERVTPISDRRQEAETVNLKSMVTPVTVGVPRTAVSVLKEAGKKVVLNKSCGKIVKVGLVAVGVLLLGIAAWQFCKRSST